MISGFVLPVLEYCSAVWCSAADTHLKLLDRAVSGARFLTGGVIECDISHRRSLAVLCMLYKISCNPVHPLNGALPGPYVPVRVTRGALVPHRYTYAPPRCRTMQFSRTVILFSKKVWSNINYSILGKKHRSQNTSIRLNGIIVSEPVLIASTFNSYFNDIPATLTNNISNNAISFESYFSEQIPESENFNQTSQLLK